MVTSFSTNTDDWAICEDTVLILNAEWVKVVTDKDNKILYGVKTDGKFYFGDGCPPQVQEYVSNFIDSYGYNKDAIDSLLATKVDKVVGKSLIDVDYSDSISVIENTEYLEATVDSDNKIIEGIKTDGTKIIETPIEIQGVRQEIIDNLDFIQVTTDSEDKILEGIKTDGTKVIELPLEIQGVRQETIDSPEFIQVITDNTGRIIEATNINGEKHISKFTPETEDMISKLDNIVNIPLLDANFTSPIPVTITGTKGGENAKYVFKLPLSEKGFNIRFKFRITENLINQSKTAVIAKLNNDDAITAIGVPLSQVTTTAEYSGQTKTNYWPCFYGGVKLNQSSISDEFTSHNTGDAAFSIKYTGSEQNVTISNTGQSFILKTGQNTHTFNYSTYDTVSKLYEALKNVTDIQLDYREIEGKDSNELAKFSESKLVSTMYTAIDGREHGTIVEYVDAAPFIIHYAVNCLWHSVEIVKIGDTIHCSCDGKQTTLSTSILDNNELTLGGNCGVLFKDLIIHTTDYSDAEYIDGSLISSENPYIIIYEGHGIDKVPSSEATTIDNMNTTIDRLQYIFSLLKNKGYVPVSIYDIADYYEGKKSLPKRCFTAIFDDLRFDNVLDLDNRSVFSKFGVKPSLAVISDRIDSTQITFNGVQITGDEAAAISRLHNFDLLSHTRNHRSNNSVKPSELMEELKADTYSCDSHKVDGNVLVYPNGATNPYIFDCLNWMGYRLGINVWIGNYVTRDTLIMSKYNLIRYEIGMRMSLSNILKTIK